MSASWVSEHCLSEDIIRQYEDGMEMEVSVNKTQLGGQTTYTATVKQRPSDTQSVPEAKKSKQTQWTTPNTSG